MDISLKITVDGTSPLMTHNPASMAIIKSPGKTSNIPSPEDEAEHGTYRLEDGSCAIPGVAFRGSILKAAGAWKKKRSMTMKSVLSHIQIAEELVPLFLLSGEPIKSFAIDRRRAIVQRNGIMRSRPRFEEWSTSFTVIYDGDLVEDQEIIKQIAADAGKRVGVGDFRPERNGWFGRFKVRE